MRRSLLHSCESCWATSS